MLQEQGRSEFIMDRRNMDIYFENITKIIGSKFCLYTVDIIFKKNIIFK